jgi:PAS domain S-box-containing protein
MVSGDELTGNWRELARSVPGGIGIQDGEELVYVSPTFLEIVGVSRDELEGYPWEVLFEPRKIAEIQTALDTARTDGYWEGNAWIVGTERVHVELALSGQDDGDTVIWSLSESNSSGIPDRENPDAFLEGDPSRLGQTVLSTVDDVIYVIGDDGRFWFWNEELAETTGYSYEEIGEMRPKEFIPENQHEYVPGLMQAIDSIEDRRVRVDILTADGERIPHEFSGTTFEDPETGRWFRCGIARDISERLQREQKIRRQHDQLAALNRINALLFKTAREALRTGDEGPVLRVLCDHAVESDFYRFAWLGKRERGTDRLTRSASRGLVDPVETIQLNASEDSDTLNTIRRAVTASDPQVSVSRDPSVQQWFGTTDEGAIESVATVPLDHGGDVSGCLVLGTKRPDAFPSQERTALEALGHLLGTVLYAVRTKKLVFATSIVELEFEAVRGESPLLTFDLDIEGTLSLNSVVPGNGQWVLYLSVEGVAPSTVREPIQAAAGVESVRIITEADQSGRIEVVRPELPLLDAVTDAGATLQGATVSPDSTRFVVDAPFDADVSHIVNHVTEEFPQADLVATHERDREPTTAARPGELFDELTPRQREVLEVAYMAGYFDWPRDSTAEAVAETLGLTPPTVHAHLRKGEQKILSEFLRTD